MTRKIATSNARIIARKVAKAADDVKRNRRGRQKMDPKAFSRAMAEKAIAETDCLELLEALTRHQNSHVKAKAARRIEALTLVEEKTALAS